MYKVETICRASCLLVAIFLYCTLLAGFTSPLVATNNNEPPQTDGTASGSPPAVTIVKSSKVSFAPILKQTAPAVVNIYASGLVKERYLSPLAEDPIFRHFFGMPMPLRMNPNRVQRSLGSGVIVSPEGIIITNHHIIESADEIRIVMADNREYIADIVVKDKRADLAALKIRNPPAKPFPIITLGTINDIEVGDLVLAIGNPFGLGQNVTSGIVSALAETQIGVRDYRFFIRTDASINPGNSGGALITLEGKLIGINRAILSPNGGSVGIGFAIPVDLIYPLINAAKGNKPLQRPWVGLTTRDLTPEQATKLKSDTPYGVEVTALYPGGPSQNNGLQVQDIILRVDNQKLPNTAIFNFWVASRPIGSKLKLTVLRNGEEVEVTLPLEAPPMGDTHKPFMLNAGRHPLLGASVTDLSPALAVERGIDTMQPGVIIIDVVHGSVADRLGLITGDIIFEINNTPIRSVQELRRKLVRPASGWHIVFRRGEDIRQLALQTRLEP